MSEDRLPPELFYKARDDFGYFAEEFLKIRTKKDGIRPFEINKSQLELHRRFEDQIFDTGKVRAIVLKGRQMGCSTYIGGRFYWKCIFRKGVRVFILTHMQDATEALFDMVYRFDENMPEFLKHETSAASAKELIFSSLDSGYKVGTAGSRAVGRSQTLQYLHGSEVAFWENADEHAGGVMQAVPDADGTEIVLESTANGVGNYFHEMCMEAIKGRNGFELVFLPWWWDNGYTKPVRDISKEDREYGDQWGLTDGQLQWRRDKIGELRGDDMRFKQEYPASVAEAFEVTNNRVLIRPQFITAARKADVRSQGPLVIGVDPARSPEGDRTAIVTRRGRVIEEIWSAQGLDVMQTTGKVVDMIKKSDAQRVFVDVIGIGAGVVDRLRELGFGRIVCAVTASHKALDEDKYANRRTEIWCRFKDWLEDGPVKIPDNDEFAIDLGGPCYDYDSRGRMKLESKDDMKKRGFRSTDIGDAAAMTFAEFVISPEMIQSRIAMGARKHAKAEYLFDPE